MATEATPAKRPRCGAVVGGTPGCTAFCTGPAGHTDACRWDVHEQAGVAEQSDRALIERVQNNGRAVPRTAPVRARIYLTAAELEVALRCMGAAGRGEPALLERGEMHTYLNLLAKLGRASVRVVNADGT